MSCVVSMFVIASARSLLNQEGGFNTKYAMDGTHMSPVYVPLLQKALAADPPKSA